VPRKPCLTCGTLTNGSYCPTHRPRSKRHPARRSGGAQATFRKRTLKWWGERCIVCGSPEKVQAHHVHGLAQGGTHDGEGVPLCRRCHRQVDAMQPPG